MLLQHLQVSVRRPARGIPSECRNGSTFHCRRPQAAGPADAAGRAMLKLLLAFFADVSAFGDPKMCSVSRQHPGASPKLAPARKPEGKRASGSGRMGASRDHATPSYPPLGRREAGSNPRLTLRLSLHRTATCRAILHGYTLPSPPLFGERLSSVILASVILVMRAARILNA